MNKAEKIKKGFGDLMKDIDLTHPEGVIILGAVDKDTENNTLDGFIGKKGCQHGINLAVKNGVKNSKSIAEAVLLAAKYLKKKQAKKKKSIFDMEFPGPAGQHPLSHLVDLLNSKNSKQNGK